MYRAILLFTLISLVTATNTFASHLVFLSPSVQNKTPDIHIIQGSTEVKVEILSPANEETFVIEYDTIFFRGDVTGYTGDIQTLAWQWESSVDGSLGSGIELDIESSTLSLGSHVITLQVQDGEGIVGEDQINITITARYPPPPPTCVGEAKVEISSPQTGGKYPLGSEIHFRGDVTGFTGNVDGLDWQWKDGEVFFANQREFTRSDIQLGYYVLYLSADVPGDCRIGTAVISMTIEDAPAHSLHLPLILGTPTNTNE